MRKLTIIVLVLLLVNSNHLGAQQMPDFTQYPAVLFHINPAYTGTKGTVDARLNYRKQWSGFSGAPVTQFAGIHSRLFKGRVGVGMTMYKDELGPLKMFDYGFSAAYHLHFPDVEFSAGIGINSPKNNLFKSSFPFIVLGIKCSATAVLLINETNLVLVESVTAGKAP